jgi:hypothetical protein
MWKKPIVIALAFFVFGFASALRANAGTEVVEPYSAPAPGYNYAPRLPPRPIFYPRPLVGVVIQPTYGYYGPRFGFYGGRQFHGRRAYWRSHHHHWR